MLNLQTLLGWPARLLLLCSSLNVALLRLSSVLAKASHPAQPSEFGYKFVIPAKAGIQLFLIVCITSYFPAHAADSAPPGFFLSQEERDAHQKTIDRVQNYLSGLSTIVADFTQVAPDGSLATGKFYLQRPGKMRWQYNPPTPVLIVSDGKIMVFYDYELEQVSHVPLNETLIGFLARDKIRFEGTVGLREIEQKDGAVRVTLAQREKYNEGQLMIEFSDKPLQLRNMVVTDAAGQITTVSLNNAKFGVKLDKELFIFRDPRQRPLR